YDLLHGYLSGQERRALGSRPLAAEVVGGCDQVPSIERTTVRLHRRHLTSTPLGTTRASRLPHAQRRSSQLQGCVLGRSATRSWTMELIENDFHIRVKPPKPLGDRPPGDR